MKIPCRPTLPDLLVVLATLSSLSGSATAQPFPAQFRGGPTHTGVTETSGVDNLGGLAWRFRTGGPVRSSPSLAGGVVYFGSTDGALYALDAHTGAELWRHPVGAPVGGAALVTEDLVVFADRSNRIHALDRTSGAEVWHVATGKDLPLPWGHEGWDYLLPSPTLVGDTVLVGSGDGHLYALALETGGERWRFATGGRIRSAPAVYAGVAYLGSGDGIVYGISVAEGREVWRFETAGVTLDAADFGFDRTQIHSSPAVVDGTLYIGSRDASLYAIDLATAKTRWTVEDGSAWVQLSPAVRGERVFSGRSSSGRVRALDAATGEETWVVATGALVFASPVVVGEVVYVVSGSGWILALDADDGSERWRYPLAAPSVSTPAVWQGRLYVGSDDGHLYALQATDGPTPELAVYWDQEIRSRSVTEGWDARQAIPERLSDVGYQMLDAAALETFLTERITDRVPSVVVFALQEVPAAIAEPRPEALLRRYLDAGGKVVWLGYPPLILERDPDTGRVTGIDRGRPAALLGVDHGGWDSDLYGVTPTPEGRRWGLETPWLGSPTVASTADVTPLAYDELGRIVAWVKRYGGPPGTGFVQLTTDSRGFHLEELRRVAEYGVFRAPVQGAR